MILSRLATDPSNEIFYFTVTVFDFHAEKKLIRLRRESRIRNPSPSIRPQINRASFSMGCPPSLTSYSFFLWKCENTLESRWPNQCVCVCVCLTAVNSGTPTFPENSQSVFMRWNFAIKYGFCFKRERYELRSIKVLKCRCLKFSNRISSRA